MNNTVTQEFLQEHIGILADMLNNNFGIDLNANDLFQVNDSRCIVLATSDLTWALPIIKKYPTSGLYAVMAYIEEEMPFEKYVTEEFTTAFNELQQLAPSVHSF